MKKFLFWLVVSVLMLGATLTLATLYVRAERAKFQEEVHNASNPIAFLAQLKPVEMYECYAGVKAMCITLLADEVTGYIAVIDGTTGVVLAVVKVTKDGQRLMVYRAPTILLNKEDWQCVGPCT
jgi:hypothetical protein